MSRLITTTLLTDKWLKSSLLFYFAGIIAFSVTLLFPLGGVASPVSQQQPKPAGVLDPVSHINPSLRPDGSEQLLTPDPTKKRLLPPTQKSLEWLVEQNIISRERAESHEPVTRAELASFLVRVLQHNPNLVSEFPFYRDVPLSHPFYQAIEVAREKQLIDYPAEKGFYHPDYPATLAELYCAIANAITGLLPEPDETDYLLDSVPDSAQLSAVLRPFVAKMIRAQFTQWVSVKPFPVQAVQLASPLTPQSIAPFLLALNQLITSRAQYRSSQLLSFFPPGIPIELSPATAIQEKSLSISDSILFTVVTASDLLPRGSRVAGVVQAAFPVQHRYMVQLNRVELPDGNEMVVNAQLTLEFKASHTQNFLVPGQRFTVVTQAVQVPASPASSKEARPK